MLSEVSRAGALWISGSKSWGVLDPYITTSHLCLKFHHSSRCPHTLWNGLQGPSRSGGHWLLACHHLLTTSLQPLSTSRGLAYAVPSLWNILPLSSQGFTPVCPLGLSSAISSSRKPSDSLDWIRPLIWSPTALNLHIWPLPVPPPSRPWSQWVIILGWI